MNLSLNYLNFPLLFIFLTGILLLACSRSQILRAPDMEPAITISSSGPKRTLSTGVVCPVRL